MERLFTLFLHFLQDDVFVQIYFHDDKLHRCSSPKSVPHLWVRCKLQFRIEGHDEAAPMECVDDYDSSKFILAVIPTAPLRKADV